MCWNCGCMRPDDDHRNPDPYITTETLRKAAIAGGPNNIHNLMVNMDAIYLAKINSTSVDNQTIS